MHVAEFQYLRTTGWQWGTAPALGGPNTLALIFAGPAYLRETGLWEELAGAFPDSLVFGCSSAGEIRGCEILDDSICGVAVRFERSQIRRACAMVTSPAESRAAGVELARQLDSRGLKAVLVLSDGLAVNGSELVKGISGGRPEGVVVTGGLAGDGPRFQQTWVYGRNGPAANRVTAVGLYGDSVRVRHGCKGGWDKFGPERRVTRSSGSVLYELDNRPALALYKEYLGERASGLPATGLLFPLAIRHPTQPETILVRTILKVDEAEQSLTFAGDIAAGSYAQLMMANFERLIQGAADAAEMSASGDQAPDQQLAIAISCVGRRLVLGERAEEELEATMAGLPERTRLVGFYSYGEISPYARTGSCELHNQTMTLTLIHEA